MADQSTPLEIRVSKDRRSLTLGYEGGRQEVFSAEMLRVLSPSAEVQGHSPEQRVTVGGKRNVEIIGIVPVGHYAIRISFSDRHDTGIFSWRYFAELAETREARWNTYLAELEAKGLTRDR